MVPLGNSASMPWPLELPPEGAAALLAGAGAAELGAAELGAAEVDGGGAGVVVGATYKEVDVVVGAATEVVEGFWKN